MNIISKDQLTPLTQIEVDGKTHYIGEVRAFNSQTDLAAFMSKTSNTNFTFIQLKPGEKHNIHSHPIASMLIVTGGSAELSGQLNRIVKNGDVVCIPAENEHGFENCFEQDFTGISVQFESSGLFDDKSNAKITFKNSDKLIEHNKKRSLDFEHSEFFSLIERGVLENKAHKKIFYRYLKQWSDKFQDIIHARQCSTITPSFKNIFSEHMAEEIGHNNILPGQAFWDPIIDSCGDWFVTKMFQLDDIDKLVVTHMVLELCGDQFYSKAAGKADVNDEYLALHAHLDEGHSTLGIELLSGLTNDKLASLLSLCDQSWTILEILLNRVAELTNQELARQLKKQNAIISTPKSTLKPQRLETVIE